eukprot:2279882-Pyramimonas_sp.AAC.1
MSISPLVARSARSAANDSRITWLVEYAVRTLLSLAVIIALRPMSCCRARCRWRALSASGSAKVVGGALRAPGVAVRAGAGLSGP